MWEFTIVHKDNSMQEIIFGYDFYDACKRANIDAKMWTVNRRIYVD